LLRTNGWTTPRGTREPDVTLLDRSAAHLPDPRPWPSALPTPRVVAGDAPALPFPEASVDIVSCCLFLHHLEPPQITRYLAEARRVALGQRYSVNQKRLHRNAAGLLSEWQ